MGYCREFRTLSYPMDSPGFTLRYPCHVDYATSDGLSSSSLFPIPDSRIKSSSVAIEKVSVRLVNTLELDSPRPGLHRHSIRCVYRPRRPNSLDGFLKFTLGNLETFKRSSRASTLLPARRAATEHIAISSSCPLFPLATLVRVRKNEWSPPGCSCGTIRFDP